MNNFGKNLKELRAEKGFSQETFTSKIGIHVTNLSKYERNISIPSLEIAEKMSKVLSISLDQLVWRHTQLVYGNNKADILIQDHQLLNLFVETQQLNENQKNTIKDLLEAFILKNNLQKQLAV